MFFHSNKKPVGILHQSFHFFILDFNFNVWLVK